MIVTVFAEFPEVTSSLCAIKEHFRPEDYGVMICAEMSTLLDRGSGRAGPEPSQVFDLLQLMSRLVITQCDC